MFGLSTKERSKINMSASTPKPTPHKVELPEGDALAEYAALAAQVGVTVAELEAQQFMAFLAKHDLPVYNLRQVVAFMDTKSAREGKGWGWRWIPLRDKDRADNVTFGTPAARRALDDVARDQPASDFYDSRSEWGGVIKPYDKTVPLHALKRVALIEKEYGKRVHFLVSDYATQPQFPPDPFLMAMLPNNTGRFVIDFWDEPGFGIDKMLAAP